MDELLEASAAALGLQRWDSAEELAGGRARAVVVRSGAATYVVKGYAAGQDGAGVRERAALAALDGAAGTPRLVAEGDRPPYVVMSRLEGSGSLADALLGGDAAHAAEQVARWAEAVAALHEAGTPRLRASFTTALAERGPGLDVRTLPAEFGTAAEQYAAVLPELGLPPHDAALAALRSLPDLLAAPDAEVLSPADTCPDNNVVGADGVRLLDLEFAELRHAAWDVAYLSAPWPSCWCAWRLPEEVADAATERYLAARGLDATSDVARAVPLAAFGWQVMTAAWFLRGALDSEDRAEDRAEDARRPGRRTMVLSRLAGAAAGGGPEPLVALAGDLHDALRRRWGDRPLALAPAFRG